MAYDPNAWVHNKKARAYFHAWLRDVNRAHTVNLTYEGVKAHALKVAHLAEYNGSLGEAQKAVLDWVKRIKAEGGNPRQISLNILR